MNTGEPTLRNIDDYEKPMPKAKKVYLIKFLTVIMLAAAIIVTAETTLIH